MMMTDDLVQELREEQRWGNILNGKAADEIERLTKKCDMQATILRRLTPETHPGTFFIYGTLGDKDQNGMPEKLMVIPTYGVDFSYIYVRAEKTTGPEW
jgi:hypothetical protein